MAYENIYMFSQAGIRSTATLQKLRKASDTLASLRWCCICLITVLWLRRPSHQKQLLFYRWAFLHLMGDPPEHPCTYPPASLRSVCFGQRAWKSKCCTYSAKCLPSPTVLCCAESVLHVIHSPCALICATVAFRLHCWLRVISRWWLLDIHFLCAFHSSKTCPKLYSNAFSSKRVPFSPSVARMCLETIPLLLALLSTAEMNTKV